MTNRQTPPSLKHHSLATRLPASCLRALAFVFAATCSQHAAAQLPLVQPAALGLDGYHLQRIDALVAEEIAAENLPGCVVAIGRRGAIGWLHAYGHRQLKPTKEKMTLDTVFDLASLTKPIATATSIMILVERGKVRLRDPVATYIPEFAQNGKDDITVEHLLTHVYGLRPDLPLEEVFEGAATAIARAPTDSPQVTSAGVSPMTTICSPSGDSPITPAARSAATPGNSLRAAASE
ncbi:MAG: beta-lactamase family protein, partial [Planctomycetes bacterium]|nr:beta-lactamase family protein [Planctomycetota bacterium]